MMRTSPLLVAAALLGATIAHADAPLPNPPKDVGFDQKLGAKIPLDLAFRDENGNAVRLADYFGKKPVVLSLVYYGCPMLCGMSLQGLVSSLRAVRFDAGKEFTVLTVSFDPTEGPTLALEKKKSILAAYNRDGAAAGWHFLTGREDAIRALTSAVGFRYVWDDAGKQFAHATGAVLLTPNGTVSRYFFGIEYPAKDVQLGLVESAAGTISGPIERLLLLCYRYDPKTGRYSLMATRLLRGSAVATVLGLGAFLFTMIRRERRGPPGGAA